MQHAEDVEAVDELAAASTEAAVAEGSFSAAKIKITSS